MNFLNLSFSIFYLNLLNIFLWLSIKIFLLIIVIYVSYTVFNSISAIIIHMAGRGQKIFDNIIKTAIGVITAANSFPNDKDKDKNKEENKSNNVSNTDCKTLDTSKTK